MPPKHNSLVPLFLNCTKLPSHHTYIHTYLSSFPWNVLHKISNYMCNILYFCWCFISLLAAEFLVRIIAAIHFNLYFTFLYLSIRVFVYLYCIVFVGGWCCRVSCENYCSHKSQSVKHFSAEPTIPVNILLNITLHCRPLLLFYFLSNVFLWSL